jgi:lipoprotein-releasing system permease protein
VTTGQHAYLRARLMQVTPHVTVLPERLEPLVPRRLVELEDGVVELVVNTPPSDRHEIKPRAEVATRARRSSRLIDGVAPFVLLKGVLRNGPRYRAVEIHGVDPTHERGIGRSPASRRRGAFAVLRASPDGVIVGDLLARHLAIRPGRDVTMITSAGVIRRLRVIGVVRSDVEAVDEARVYVNIELAQSLRGMARNAATGLALHVTSPERAERVATAVERATGYRTETWEEMSADALMTSRAREIAAWAVAALSLVVAAFGLANALTASVLSARERASVDRATEPVGAALIVMEGTLLGIVGGAIGAGAGMGAAYWLSRGRIDPFGFIDTFVRFDRPPVSIEPVVFVTTVALASLVALAATIAPARHTES